MNIKLNEWNKLIEYGKELCNILIERGYDVRLKPYTVYDGRKGLSMQVFDDDGNYFKEYYSGIDTFNTMRESMRLNFKRIIAEC